MRMPAVADQQETSRTMWQPCTGKIAAGPCWHSSTAVGCSSLEMIHQWVLDGSMRQVQSWARAEEAAESQQME